MEHQEKWMSVFKCCLSGMLLMAHFAILTFTKMLDETGQYLSWQRLTISNIVGCTKMDWSANGILDGQVVEALKDFDKSIQDRTLDSFKW